MRSLKAVVSSDAFFSRCLLFQKITFVCYLVSLVTSMSAMEIFSSLWAAGTLVCLILRPPSRKDLPPFLWPMLAFVLIVVVGVLAGDARFPEKLYDISRMRFFLLYVLLYYNFKYYVSDVPWMKVLFFACLAVGIYGFFQHFTPLDLLRPEGKKIIRFAVEEGKIGPLVIGTFNHHLTFANIFLLYACLFVSIGFGQIRRFWRELILGAFLLLLCVWTGSRAAWAAIPIVVLILAAGKSWKAMLVCLVAIGLVAVGSYCWDRGFAERINRTFFQRDDLYNLGPRVRLWRAQLEMFKEHPVLGMGYNNNERQAKKYVDRLYPEVKDNFYGHAHSTPLQILATTGVAGAVAYVVLWLTIFVHLFGRIRGSPSEDLRWISLGLIAAFVGFQIQGLTQWNFGDAEVLHNVIFFWVLAAVAGPHPRCGGITAV